ncbi:MAG: endonuclease/exonuclease/phosphatase family protein [Prosthecobacter sp.]
MQYLIAGFVVLIYALFRRSSWLVLMAVASLLWNGRVVLSCHATATPAEATLQKPLRVLTFNVMAGNANQAAVIDYVVSVDADIVCLLETNESWRSSLAPLRERYPYHVEELGAGYFSIACYTRLPVKSSGVRRFTTWALPVVFLNLDRLGSPLTFIGIHPDAPMRKAQAREWRVQLSQIGSLVAEIDGDVIVAGDFNATPWCEGMRLLREKSGLDFRSVDPVWPPTWGLNLPMMIPIDHVLVKGGLTVQKRTIGPDLGSDHRPVTVDILSAR